MLFFSVFAATALGARELTDADFNQVIEGQAFVKFFAPWCGHCKNMKPAWDDLEKEFINSPVVTIADVDCTAAGKDICNKMGVKGFPTVKYFISGEAFDYKGSRSLPELKSFVEKTFKPLCEPVSGTNCSAEQKDLIEQYKGKNLDTELSALEEEKKKRAVDFADVKKKFKTEQDRLKKAIQLIQLLKKSTEAGKDEL